MFVTEQKPNPHAPDLSKPIVAKKSAMVQFLSMNLVLEAVVVLFGTVVASKFIQIDELKLTQVQVWTMGCVMALLFIVASGMQKTLMGRYFGGVIQVPFIVMSLYIDLMIIVSVVFVAIWAASWWLGAKIDRERSAYDAANPETAPNV